MRCICGRHIAQHDPWAKVNDAGTGKMRVLTCDHDWQVALALLGAVRIDRTEAWDYALQGDPCLSTVPSLIESLNHNRVRSLDNRNDATKRGARHRRRRSLTSDRIDTGQEI